MRDQCVFVPKLFYCSPTAYFSQVTQSGVEYINNTLDKIKTPTRTKPVRLYLSRQQANKRKVINNREVESFLNSQRIYYCKRCGIVRDSLELFRNAEVVVGPHGSMFNNILFCPQSVKVVEFCPENRRDFNFRGLGLTRKLDYHWIEAPADDHHNINIDINILKKLL